MVLVSRRGSPVRVGRLFAVVRDRVLERVLCAAVGVLPMTEAHLNKHTQPTNQNQLKKK